MIKTMKQAVGEMGLIINEEVNAYGLSGFGLVVVKCPWLMASVREATHPLHTVFGKSFFFCLFGKVY